MRAATRSSAHWGSLCLASWAEVRSVGASVPAARVHASPSLPATPCSCPPPPPWRHRPVASFVSLFSFGLALAFGFLSAASFWWAVLAAQDRRRPTNSLHTHSSAKQQKQIYVSIQINLRCDNRVSESMASGPTQRQSTSCAMDLRHWSAAESSICHMVAYLYRPSYS